MAGRREGVTFQPRRALVILPTYNERDNIPEILPRILEQDRRIHVLIVDDNSPDGTGVIADGLAAVEPRISVLHRASKLGLGTAYVEGFRWGLEQGFDVLIEMDADFSHDPTDLKRLLKTINEADVVVGSRYANGEVTVVHWPITRLFLSYFANVYARLVTELPLSDATGGFNAFRHTVLEGIDLESIQSEGYAFQVEVKHRAWHSGAAVMEIPIVFTDRTRGDSKMSRGVIWEAVWRLWSFRLRTLGTRAAGAVVPGGGPPPHEERELRRKEVSDKAVEEHSERAGARSY